MIVTVTPNPSLDRTFTIDDLRRGHVLRATSTSLVPSGKGVNVSRVLAANGAETLAVLPIGGHDGEFLAAALATDGMTLEAVPIGGRIRSNVTVLEPDGTATKLNEPGPTLTTAEVDRLAAAAIKAADGAVWLVGSGSLPPGMSGDFYAQLVDRVAARVAVDVTGAALLAAADAGATLLKPNTSELAEVVGSTLTTIADADAAAGELRRRGAANVLVSLGSDGALLITADGTWFAHTEARTFISAVGAGDTLLAGFLLGGGIDDPTRAVGTAVGLAARRCELPPTEQPRRVDTQPAVAQPLTADLAARTLAEPAL